MKPADFVSKYYPFAKQSQDKTGISGKAILAQAATESAWGDVAPGNMFFGVKDTDGINGNEQLLTTTEYCSDPYHTFPKVLSVVQVGKRLYKYKVQDWFRKYATPEECFTDHANFFLKNERYAKALEVKEDPIKFVQAIAQAGYATDPYYAKTLISVISIINKNLK